MKRVAPMSSSQSGHRGPSPGLENLHKRNHSGLRFAHAATVRNKTHAFSSERMRPAVYDVTVSTTSFQRDGVFGSREMGAIWLTSSAVYHAGVVPARFERASSVFRVCMRQAISARVTRAQLLPHRASHLQRAAQRARGRRGQPFLRLLVDGPHRRTPQRARRLLHQVS